MNYRKALDNPGQFMQATWGSPERCPCRPQIEALASQWAALSPDYKSLLDAKGSCSRAIGEARRNDDDTTLLKQRMADISRQLGALESQRKTLEQQLAALVEDEQPEQAEPVPVRFQAASGAQPAAGVIHARLAQAADADRWEQFVSSHPRASLYHHYGWRDLIQRSFGHETLYWLAEDDAGHIVGVLPMVRLASRLFGDFAVSLPYFNYGGVLTTTSEARAHLLDAATHYAQTNSLSHLELREMSAAGDWPARTDKASMILALPDSVEALDAQIGSKVRAQIRQARRHRHQVAIGGKELLDAFYRVFATNMRDLGTPVYSKQFFANILDTWKDQATLVVIHAPQPVAAAFLLGYRDMMEIPWASTLRTANAMNMNMLLYWEVLAHTVQQGFRFFDFGRSTIDAGTYQFKKQWGARPFQHHWHYWLPLGAELPKLTPDNPKYRLAINVWRRLPVAVTTAVGPHIVKYLP
jgi:FemAB-related protein (PEP-CTERM system-associated)